MLHTYCTGNNNHYRKKLGEPTMGAFLDLRKAFHSVERGLLIKTMITRNVDSKIFFMINEMCRRNAAQHCSMENQGIELKIEEELDRADAIERRESDSIR